MSAVRGMRDLGPDETEHFEQIRQTFTELAGLYSFRLMEPSPMEPLETLEAKSGPGIKDEIYFFKDKAGRELGLRFDLTVGMTRFACADRGASLPIKLACFGGVFRYDEPQRGRYRWFYQWDLESYGSPNPEADAELVDFTSNLLGRAGFDQHLVKVGDRRVVEEFIAKKLGRSGDQGTELMRALDKVDKKTEEEIVAEYASKGFREDEVRRLLGFGRTEGSPDGVCSLLAEQGLESAEGLAQISSMLRGTRAKFGLCMSVVRGIDYYTSVVFEACDVRGEGVGSIAGGGRYDLLPGIFGRKDLSATGVAGGVERLMLSSRRSQAARDGRTYVAFTGETAGEALRISSDLRRAGVRVMVDLQRRSLSKQLEMASKQGFDRAVIVAPRELSEGKVIVKALKDKTEALLPLASLAKELA
ncbi:MAG: histidine--tRNA ligase [Nitrososphaerota archaeon]|nr:histidine--tRNA ligase [Nitrososphaerota archaeon]MDG6939319.1 histidine--tRNA ligase [Nitrososphaerota archaeon]